MSEIRIGKSQVYASSLGLGTNAVGGHNLFPDLKDEIGKEVVRTALNSGLTLLDTAFAYGNGRSEELIGEVLQEKNYDRSRVIVATKAAHDLNGPERFNNSPTFLEKSVEEALRRLQTDYLDIFYIHFPDEKTPKSEAVGALQRLKEAGKIRAIGVSNFSLDQIKEANQDGFLDVVEDRYSLIHREAETQLFPYLKEKHITFIPYFPLASGLLTGKYKKEEAFEKGVGRGKNPDFVNPRFEKIIEKVASLKPIALENEVTVPQLVLAWYLKNEDLGPVIPGAKKPHQVKDNALAMDVHLSFEDYEKINKLFN